jgi:hypothetical protein
MASPARQILLVDSDGQRLDIGEVVARLRQDPDRVLADDDVGLVLCAGDLSLYQLAPTDGGDFLAQHVTEISKPRFPVDVIRRQIGATVMSLTGDAVFVVRQDGILRKVRADALKPGMVLASGDKVYR